MKKILYTYVLRIYLLNDERVTSAAQFDFGFGLLVEVMLFQDVKTSEKCLERFFHFLALFSAPTILTFLTHTFTQRPDGGLYSGVTVYR
jgi:hypothetical protein